MRTRWRVPLGAATAAAVSAALAWGQPWLTSAAGVFSWEDIGCGSADGGDENWMSYGWVVWWTASAVLVGALAGAKVAGLSRGFGGDVRRAGDVARYAGGHLVLAAVAVAAAVRPAYAALDGLTARALPDAVGGSCHSADDYRSTIATAIVVALLSIAFAAGLPETAFAFVAGWVWIWLLNGQTYVRFLLGDEGLEHIGGTRGASLELSHISPRDSILASIAMVAGYLAVLPGLVWWHAFRRTREASPEGERVNAVLRALLSVVAAYFLVFIGMASLRG